MRDKERIPKILSGIEKIWKENPDLRLGQLLKNLRTNVMFDFYYIEDEKLLQLLKEYYE